MNTVILKTSCVLILFALITSCDKDVKSNLETNYEYIKYGTSFNNCIGYCYNSVTISDSIIEYEKKGRDINGNLPDFYSTKTIDHDYWINLQGSINFNSFMQLDSIIGCPDCADGGAEWIEINTIDKKHKVTFEFGKEPEEVKSLLGYLKTSLKSIEDIK
jgi:hypothetical protein